MTSASPLLVLGLTAALSLLSPERLPDPGSPGCAVARCTCIAPPPPQTARAAADAVFLGTVVRIADVNVGIDGSEVRMPAREVTFRVHAAWRGLTRQSERVIVTTGYGGGDCGFEFARDSIYLVYASGQPAGLSTSICSRTALASEAESDFEALGQPQVVIDG